MKIIVEPVQKNELKELSDLAIRTYCDAFGYSMKKQQLHKIIENNRSVDYFQKKLEDSTILVAKSNKKIVGYVQFEKVKIPEVNKLKGDMELSKIYVETQLQNKGIGKLLMETAINDKKMKTAPNIYLQVWEENKKAIHLYKKYGFKIVGTTSFDLGGDIAQDLIMKKSNK